MPSLDAPCFLLPHGSEKSAAYVCIPVDTGLAKRSPVIETLMEFEGLVELPEGVSLDVFETWAALQTDNPTQLKDEELSFALRVGDKLSALDTARLAKTLAERLKTAAWDCSRRTHSILNAVLPLDRHLQQLVFNNLSGIPVPTLITWPPQLQQVYAERWVCGKERSFYIDHSVEYKDDDESVRGVLALLSRTDPALPRLRSLSLHCPIPSTSTADALCRALHHHSSLSRLIFHHLPWQPGPYSTAAAAVFRTLPQLTALTSLTLPCSIGIPTSDMAPSHVEATSDCVHALAAAVSSLSCLATFCLHQQSPRKRRLLGTGRNIPADAVVTTEPSTAGSATKRRRIASCLGPASMHTGHLSLDPIIAALSTAPALTVLCFSCFDAAAANYIPCRGIRGPFTSLQQLHFTISREDFKASSLLYVDPLPALTSMSICARDEQGFDPFLEEYLMSTARQPVLMSMSVHLGHRAIPAYEGDYEEGEGDYEEGEGDYEEGEGDYEEGDSEEPCLQRSDGVSCGDASQEVRLVLESMISARCMRSVAAHLAHLTSLRSLAVLGDGSCETICEMEREEDLHAMLQPLAALTQLQALSVGCFDGALGEISRAALAVPLQAFSQLTSLHLSFDDGVSAARLGEGLQTVTQLQRVSVTGVKCARPEEVAECFSPLRAVTRLRVSLKPVNSGTVQCFAEAVACMPQLDSAELRTEGASGYPAHDWMEGLVHLPAWGCYTFAFFPRAVDSHVIERITSQLVSRGAVTDDALQYISFRKSAAASRLLAGGRSA